jgi:hypothetical protein
MSQKNRAFFVVCGLTLVLAMSVETIRCAPVAAAEILGALESASPAQYVRVNWEQNCVEAAVSAAPPLDASGAEGIAIARSIAIDKLYFELTVFLLGSDTERNFAAHETMISDVSPTETKTRYNRGLRDYTKSELKKNDLSKYVTKNIEVVKGEWDGDLYTVFGRLPLPQISEPEKRHSKPRAKP